MSEIRHADVRLAEDRVPPAVPYGFLAFVVLFGATLSVAAWLLLVASLGHRVLRAPARADATIGTVRQTPIDRERPGEQRWREQREALERFDWVDREAGIVQIPVEEAARLLIGAPP
jgi:hypothetical protein